MPPSDDIKVITDRRPTKADEDEYGHVWMEPEPFTDRPWCNVCAAYVGPGVPWCHTDSWIEPQPLPEIKVGQVWRRADGEHVTVLRYDKRGILPFHVRSESNVGTYYYTRSGKAPGAGDSKDLVELIADAPAPEPATRKVPRLFAAPIQRTVLSNNMCYLDAIADDGTCWWMGPDRGGWAQHQPLPDREEPTNV